jgi:two-component system, OmpR family, sensor histidine kinase MtrB
MTRWGRLGLRARVMVAFALGSLALTLTLSVLTYTLATNQLIRQRERSALRLTVVNARLIQDRLRATDPDVPELLASLDTPAGSQPVLHHRDRWFGSWPAPGDQVVPAGLRQDVLGGTAARQRVRVDGRLYLVVGLPLAGVDAAYFELFPLAELEDTARTLSLALAAAAAATILVGAGFGRWVSGQLLRPLSEAARAAGEIRRGRLETRLARSADPDLAVLAGSFNEMVDALQRRIERDARFTSDVSHELRSPLTTLATTVEVLHGQRDELSPVAREAVDLLQGDVERFQRMVLDLLEISKFDAGAQELVLQEVKLAELARRVVDVAGVPVTADREAAETVIRADRRRLERVVANLVENADVHGRGLAGLQVVRADGTIRLLVDDAGPGVPAGFRERVFERFARGPAAGAPRGDGAGLGLALVAEQIRLHGGRVWVEDRPGGGARFVVELPVDGP